MSYVIKTYIDNGLVYKYTVQTAESAREHSCAIVMSGYRHVGDGEFTHFPPHRILKVKVIGNINTNYPDEIEGT